MGTPNVNSATEGSVLGRRMSKSSFQSKTSHEPRREINPQANQFPHNYSLDATPPTMETQGELRIVSQMDFPIQNSMTGAKR
jgi:hypothetical protein